MGFARIRVLVVMASLLGGAGFEPLLSEFALPQNPPANAVFCPADYDGDGLMDFAVKGSNGIWYIDVAKCSEPDKPETACSNYIDDDLDGFVNDGCPAVGTSEVTMPGGCDAPYNTAFDDDNDGFIDDGCPTNHQCLGSDGFGGRWDFAYPGYGDDSGIPVPADYGTLYNGPADGRADLAIKDSSGMWAIDYAENGFGTFDQILYGYGFSNAVPWPADYDGDGRADLSVRTNDGSGAWYFDYSSDGFGGWNIPCTNGCPCTVQPGAGYPIYGYGGGLDTPAIGDFNGDSCADISVKDQTGNWYFDLSGDGFGWQPPCTGCAVPLPGYGNYNHHPIVANYDPDFDDKADLAVHTPDGYWAIDFAADGFGTWNTFPFYHAGWGSGAAKLVPGHYTSTSGNLDQGIKTNFGYWYLDSASTGYGNYDATLSTTPPLLDTSHAYIDGMFVTRPVVPPGPTSGNFAETKVSPTQLKIGVRYTVNVHLNPGTACNGNNDNDGDGVSNDGCPLVGAPETLCSDWLDNDSDGYVNDGCPAVGPGEFDEASVRVNPDLRVPTVLNVEDVGGHTVQNSALPIVYRHFRRFGFTCNQWGSYPLGFMVSGVHTSTALNADYGIGVTCTADYPGLYGWVKNKKTGAAIPFATVTVNGMPPVQADSNGLWNVPGLTGGPYRIVVTKSGFAPVEAVNVRVPPFGSPSGIQVDTALEESFVLQTGITYKTYIDYSRGRTILHTVTIDVTRAPITLGKIPLETNGTDFKLLLDVATAQNAPVMINGIWWTLPSMHPDPPANGLKVIGENRCELQHGPPISATRSIGYLYINGFVPPGFCAGGVCRPSELECSMGEMYADPQPGRPPGPPVLIQNAWQTPMFGVKGTGTQRRANIIMTDTDFLTSNNGWKRVASIPNCPPGFTCPIYDAARPSNQSDYLYAFQMGHVLLRNGSVIARGVLARIGTAFPGEFAFSRTTIGTNATGTRAWLVLADGEGIDGGNGGTPHQLGEFYRDILQASDAMIIDSGESTELVLRGTGGPRRVNTLSSENHAADGVAPDGDYVPSGRVFSYIKVGM